MPEPTIVDQGEIYGNPLRITSSEDRDVLLPHSLAHHLLYFGCRKGSVEHRDLIEATFPVGLIVATSAEKHGVQSSYRDGGGPGFDFELSIQVNPHRVTIAYKESVVPLPALNLRAARNDFVILDPFAAEEHKSAGMVRATNAELIAVGVEPMVAAAGKHPTGNLTSIGRHTVPEP